MSGKNKTNKQTKTKEEQAFVSEWHPPFNIHRKKKSSEESLSLQTTSTYFHDALLLP
jgi:hypothetical protein